MKVRDGTDTEKEFFTEKEFSIQSHIQVLEDCRYEAENQKIVIIVYLLFCKIPSVVAYWECIADIRATSSQPFHKVTLFCTKRN